MRQSNTQRELIVRASEGDRVALQQLLLEHYTRLSRRIEPKLAGPLGRAISVDDILQETFIRAMRDIDRCAARCEASFAAWLNALADHQLQDTLKGLRRKKRGGDRRQVDTPTADRASSMVDLVALLSDPAGTPSRLAARREAVRAIHVSIAGLPDNQREAIRLRYLSGKSLAETAAAMQRSRGAVRGLLQRAKQALRNAMIRSSLWLSKK